MRKTRLEADRFWEKVDKNGPLITVRLDLGPCHLWTGAKTDKGYGNFKRTPVRSGIPGAVIGAHLWAWFEEHGTIPDGLEPDHLCHTLDPDCLGGWTCVHRLCVNTAHMELVTRVENCKRARSKNRAKTHCPLGHEYSEENTEFRNGRRHCKECGRTRVQLKRAIAKDSC